MPQIRYIEITNFRGIKKLRWSPDQGLNCLIGAGDSGKSSVVDAIDLCLGGRRNVQFSDADFYNLNVEAPIVIEITIGELSDTLKNLDSFGLYLRSYDAELGLLEDEPEAGTETVITVQLKVGSDLEPAWALVSERAASQGQARSLRWADRLKLSPTRIGTMTGYDLSWRKGSVLTRLSEEEADSAAAFAKISRDARTAFGDTLGEQLQDVRKLVTALARELGVSVGGTTKALLDPDSLSLSGGTIALHSEAGVPLRGLGTGSARLLVAGLQRKASEDANILLVDELEHGLEPHRIIRFLGSIGAKDEASPIQAFITTHSPVAIRELSASQIFVLRKTNVGHEVRSVAAVEEDLQGTIRLYPEAFLASSVLVCEGASEVGLMRGLDLHRANGGTNSIYAQGVALVDAGGVSKLYTRASAFQALGFRTAVLRDDDVQPDPKMEIEFVKAGGTLFSWRAGKSTEDEIFSSLSDGAVLSLIEKATEFYDLQTVDDHIKSVSNGKWSAALAKANPKDVRAVLSKASKTKNSPWFKSVSAMEDVAKTVIGPDKKIEPGFSKLLQSIFKWTHGDNA